MRKIFLAMIFSLILPLSVNAWWSEGHQTIAEIAYRHLNSKAKNQVNHLVNTFKHHDGNDHNLYYMAVWPDLLASSGVRIFSTWHYIDTPYYAEEVQEKNHVNHDNVLLAIEEAKKVLAFSHAPDYEKARFLSFLIHTTGDVHQPLHAIGRVTYKHPHGDRGGNDFPISYTGKHDSNLHNLHMLWDTALGELDQSFYKEAVIKKHADEIEAEYPLTQMGKEARDIDPDHWAKGSYDIAVSNVYQIDEDSSPSDEYIRKNIPVARRQIALAGYRLANMLNYVFGTH